MISSVISVVSALLIKCFVDWLAIPILEAVLSNMNSWVASAFYIEYLFNSSVNKYFDLEAITSAIFTFALAFLVMCFVVRIIKVYFSWSNGDPETSPMTVLVGFLKALIVMVCFGFLYNYFVMIINSMYTTLLDAGFSGGFSDNNVINTLNSISFNFFGSVVILIIAIEAFLIYIDILGRGIQLLILRLGMAFAAIGLLNSDGGVFKNYLKKFLQSGFAILVQVFLLSLSISLIISRNYLLALITASTAVKGGQIINDFLAPTGSGASKGILANAALVGQASGLAVGAVGAVSSMVSKPVGAGVMATAQKNYNKGTATYDAGKSMYKTAKTNGDQPTMEKAQKMMNSGKERMQNSANSFNMGSKLAGFSKGISNYKAQQYSQRISVGNSVNKFSASSQKGNYKANNETEK